MFYSINFWRQISFLSFRYSLFLMCFLIWALINNYTDTTITLFNTTMNLFFVVTLSSSLVVFILMALRKKKNRYRPWLLLLVDGFTLLFLLANNFFSALFNSWSP